VAGTALGEHALARGRILGAALSGDGDESEGGKGKSNHRTTSKS
jgi:hypothetical protein